MNQAPLNTHSVGIGGLILVALGIFAPSLAHAFHASPDIVQGLQNITNFFIGAGSVGAYVGKPLTVKD